MRNFVEYYDSKEKAEDSRLNGAFEDAEGEVKNIFSALHKIMLNTWGNKAPSWDTQVRNKVIADLQNAIDKLKGKDNKTNGQAVETAKGFVRESIVVCEGRELPSWIQEIIGRNRTITVDRMLTAMQNEVIKILHKLRDEMLVKQVSGITGEVGKVGKKLSRRVGNIGKDIQQQIAAGVQVHRPVTGQERETGRFNLIRLYNKLKYSPNIRLYSGVSATRQLRYDPNNTKEMTNILDKINRGKNFRIRISGKDHFFDITDEGDVNRVIELIGEHGV